MKKLNIALLLVLFTLLLGACTKQSNLETPLINKDNDFNQTEISVNEEGDIMALETVYTWESWKTLIAEDCQSFFDGCNNCQRMEDGSEIACTLIQCESYQEPVCLD